MSMFRSDEDTLRSMRAASPALQEWWPDHESPRSWKGVTWSDDRVQVLNFYDSKLEALSPETGQLLALTTLVLWECEQLTLAPGVRMGQPAPSSIVAAYAPLLVVEPHKDTPDQLHAFLLANPLAVPPFFKSILTDTARANWLYEAVKATPSLAGLTDADGRRAIDVAYSVCKQAMEVALFLLGPVDVDDGGLLHGSSTYRPAHGRLSRVATPSQRPRDPLDPLTPWP